MPSMVLFREVSIEAVRTVLLANLLAYPIGLFVLGRTDFIAEKFFGL